LIIDKVIGRMASSHDVRAHSQGSLPDDPVQGLLGEAVAVNKQSTSSP
jgi:hypothetical protein